MSEPNLYNVGYDVGFEDGFKEAQARIEELEAEIKSMAMDCLVAKGQASDAYQAQLKAEATLRKLEQWFDTDQEILDVMGNNEKADHMRKLKMIRDALGGDSDD